MTPKELMYIEDALSHEQFLVTQCKSAAQQLQDQQLRSEVQQLIDKHNRIYGSLYKLV